MDALVAQMVQDVYALQTQRARPSRKYLGLSFVGNECTRALWYSHRGAYVYEHEPRKLRLFETGEREEDRIIAELKAAGYEVQERDPKTRRQWEVSDLAGHIKGHLDGKILLGDTWLLLEIKTSNTSGYNALIKHGLKAKKPLHYAQMQTYMHYTGLPGAIYIVHCKENDRLHAEYVPYNEEEAQHYVDRASYVVGMDQPPEKAYKTNGWPCNICDYFAICKQVEPVAVDCRTCMHAQADTDAGGWKCHRWNQTVPDKFLEIACDDHIYISPLLEERHGGVVEYDVDAIDRPVMWITYQDDSGQRVTNRAASSDVPGMTSAELAALEITRIDVE